MPIHKRGGGSGLPTIAAGDASKVLAVNAEETGYELVTPSTGGADEAAVLSLLFAFGD